MKYYKNDDGIYIEINGEYTSMIDNKKKEFTPAELESCTEIQVQDLSKELRVFKNLTYIKVYLSTDYSAYVMGDYVLNSSNDEVFHKSSFAEEFKSCYHLFSTDIINEYIEKIQVAFNEFDKNKFMFDKDEMNDNIYETLAYYNLYCIDSRMKDCLSWTDVYEKIIPFRKYEDWKELFPLYNYCELFLKYMPAQALREWSSKQNLPEKYLWVIRSPEQILEYWYDYDLETKREIVKTTTSVQLIKDLLSKRNLTKPIVIDLTERLSTEGMLESLFTDIKGENLFLMHFNQVLKYSHKLTETQLEYFEERENEEICNLFKSDTILDDIDPKFAKLLIKKVKQGTVLHYALQGVTDGLHKSTKSIQ